MEVVGGGGESETPQHHNAVKCCGKKMIIYGFKINLKKYIRFLPPEKNAET